MRQSNYVKFTEEMTLVGSAEPSSASMLKVPEDLVDAPFTDDLPRDDHHRAPYLQDDASENLFLRGVFWALLASILFWSAMIWGAGSIFSLLPKN